ncbi:hypothetical protein GCM10027566_29050 [Arachidicoccus ginsenosidivorans]|uniref:TlpA family protein disulfide reductase n=1 Tax=Arachidicoccus ginsenosidivorans TaxID=496057 RepID=A0A5B8VMR8_9BACT|nr:TlpA disulfide reductase family protein [Arachidicoccus ginsenosidivorans]QEC72874.1 TlpA family protein disulfide reductase [Arachidicoccus ginsenosidivorans]
MNHTKTALLAFVLFFHRFLKTPGKKMGKTSGKTLYTHLGKLTLLVLLSFIAVTLQAQNMMTELSDSAELAWYNQHFSRLEDSVTHYQEAIKQPQVPAQRKANLRAYQNVLSHYRAAMRRFVLKHRDQDTGAKALLISCFREIEINQDTLHSLAGLLQGNGANNSYAAYLRQELKGRANNQVGQAFIDFVLPDDQGHMIATKAYSGKYVLVLFWASWCGPCRAEMPSFLAVYHQFKDRPLEVIAVSVDTDKASWLRAKKQDRTDWINVYDGQAWNSPVVRNYAIHRIPQNILIGPEGKIVAKNISAQGLLKLMAKSGAMAR